PARAPAPGRRRTARRPRCGPRDRRFPRRRGMSHVPDSIVILTVYVLVILLGVISDRRRTRQRRAPHTLDQRRDDSHIVQFNSSPRPPKRAACLRGNSVTTQTAELV